MKRSSFAPQLKRLAARSGAVLFLIVAFEILIMISPFAFFFYSVFNPVLHWLGGFRATVWLTAFFLPHMILPPTFLLKSIRIAGSVLFIAGCLTFTTCALQVYPGKMFRWGIAGSGLYGLIRHPQYLALGLWGFGMAIMWPRFLVLATLPLLESVPNVTFLGLGCRLKSEIGPCHLMMGLPGRLIQTVHQHIGEMAKPIAMLKNARVK